jgi:hypothetical protein
MCASIFEAGVGDGGMWGGIITMYVRQAFLSCGRFFSHKKPLIYTFRLPYVYGASLISSLEFVISQYRKNFIIYS